VIEYAGVLEKLVCRGHGLETGFVNEMVIDAVLFAVAQPPGGMGSRYTQAAGAFHQRPHQTGLTAARRRRNHKQMTAGGADLGPSHAAMLAAWATASGPGVMVLIKYTDGLGALEGGLADILPWMVRPGLGAGPCAVVAL
jgi:hypothetical protein